MAFKSDAKSEEKLTFGSKDYMRNLINFIANRNSLKIFTLICYFCQEHIKFLLKKYTKVFSHDAVE